MKNNLPKITVITVVFNGEKTLEKTILSVINQTYENIEYIIIDGGSEDSTIDIITAYEGAIDYWVSQEDDGIYDAMNKGISFSSGEFVIFMNSGDIFISQTILQDLAYQIAEIETDVIFGRWLRFPENVECNPNCLKGFFNHQSVIYRSSLHLCHGKYINCRDFTTADYAFFFRLINDPLVRKIESTNLISEVDTNGISSGLQTLSQKSAIDYLYGRISRWRLAGILLFHPIYFFIKKTVKWKN